MSRASRQRRSMRRRAEGKWGPELSTVEAVSPRLARWKRLTSEACGFDVADVAELRDGMLVAWPWGRGERLLYTTQSALDVASDSELRDSLIATIAREGLAHA